MTCFPPAHTFRMSKLLLVKFYDDLFMNKNRVAYGDNIDTQDAFTNFLIDTSGLRTGSDASDLRIPAILSPTLLTHASSTHAAH